MLEKNFTLRHKDKDVAQLCLDEDGCLESFKILNEEELPIPGSMHFKNIGEWLDSRAIPSGRKELAAVLRREGCKTPEEYLVKNLGLSLTDSYWLCPESFSGLTWSQVNLYSHAGQILTFHDGYGRAVYSTGANASVGGSLEKKAVYRKGHWILVKKDNGKSGFGLQNINEAFASYLHIRQGFTEHVTYTPILDSSGICTTCACPYFTDESHELISAFYVAGGLQAEEYNGKRLYDQFVHTCVENGLQQAYVQNFMDYMLLTDFLITNTDRHWENFGILRDPDTLQFESMAPIFDSGTSMMCDQPYIRFRLPLLRLECNGICRMQQDNLALVQNKKAVNIDRLPVKQDVMDFYERFHVPEAQADQIACCYNLKRDMLIEFQRGLVISIDHELKYGDNPPVVDGHSNAAYVMSKSVKSFSKKKHLQI